VHFGFEREKGPGRGEKRSGTRDGRILATIEIRAMGGTAGNARLTVTGPVRWVRFPPSCQVRGSGLSCGLGDLAGTTVLRLGFQEKGTGGEKERLRAVVESANTPEVVRTVRLPGPGEGSWRTGERAKEPLKAAPARPSGVRTAVPGPVRPRALGPEPAPPVSGSLSPATKTKSSPATKTRRKPSRDADVLRSPSSSAATPSRSARPSRISPAAPAVPAAPAAPGVIRTPPAVEPPSALPLLPKEPVVALPPVRPTEMPPPSPRLSVTSAEGPLADDGREWLVVLAVALAGEAALLWFVTALALWRRRA